MKEREWMQRLLQGGKAESRALFESYPSCAAGSSSGRFMIRVIRDRSNPVTCASSA